MLLSDALNFINGERFFRILVAGDDVDREPFSDFLEDALALFRFLQ